MMITKTCCFWSRGGEDALRGIVADIRKFEADGWAVKLWHWHTRGVYVVFEREAETSG